MNNPPREARIVKVTRGKAGLGFHFIGANYKFGAFVSLVQTHSSAQLAGLSRGDQILKVNNTPVAGLTHQQVTQLMNNHTEPDVTLLVQYKPMECRECESDLLHVNGTIHAIAQLNSSARDSGVCVSESSILDSTAMSADPLVSGHKSTFHVRALFSYEPDKDTALPTKGLSIDHGDILYLVNANDFDWWQAQKVDLLTGECFGSAGVVPSAARMHRRRRRAARRVNFAIADGSQASATSSSSSSTGRTGVKPKLYTSRYDTAASPSVSHVAPPPSPSATESSFVKKGYSSIMKRFVGRSRRATDKTPNGEPMKQEARAWSLDSVLVDGNPHPDEGGDVFYERVARVSIDHTRPVIVMGVARDQIYDYIVARQPEKYQLMTLDPEHDDLWLTQLKTNAVNHLHSLICVNDVRLLPRVSRACQLHPITVLLVYRGAMHLRQVLNSACEVNRPITVDSYLSMWTQAMQLQSPTLAHNFVACVSADSFQELVDLVLKVVERNSGREVWLPSNDAIG